VIPKAPSWNLLDADPVVLGKVMPTVQRIGRAVVAATGADGLRLVQYNEAPAGQSVFHLHFHLMPVYEGKAFGAHAEGRADDVELATLAREIAALL
jgi:histidine triad (HIT) family protein